MNSVSFELIAMGQAWRAKDSIEHVYSFVERVTEHRLSESQRSLFLEKIAGLPEGKSHIQFLGETFSVNRRVTRSTKEDKRWEVKLSYGI